MSSTLTDRLVPGTDRPTAKDLDEAQKRLGQAYPPSFRELVIEHGLFALRKPGEERSRFQVWPLDEHKTALERAAEELDCDATAAAVGEELGLPKKTVAVLGQIVLIGEENDDFVGFDLRTRTSTGEAAFVLHLMDDLEIEYLASAEGAEGTPGFAPWVEEHAKRNH